MDAERNTSRLPDLDQIRVLDVVDHDRAPEAASELRRDDPQLLEVALGEPAGKPTCEEQGLVLDRDACAPELVDDGPDRLSSGVVVRGRDRQGRRLDHDRRAATASNERLERLAGEWEPERVPHGCADVGDRLARLEWPQDDGVGGCVHDRQPRPREHRDAVHGSAR